MLKNITFKTIKEHDCHHELHRVCGDVKHCTVEIPFHLFVEVPGTKPGDKCEVEEAIVAGAFEKLIEPDKDGTFHKLLEKVIIKVRAKSIRIRRIKVEGHDITPKPLECKFESKVVEEEGLGIPEEELKEHEEHGHY